MESNKIDLQYIDILDICDIKYLSNERIDSFYRKFRSSICCQLKKKGDKIIIPKDQQLLEHELLDDEIISPTFEEIILLWCLEKIDPKLPLQVKRAFNEQFKSKTSLCELQTEIFEVLPLLLNYNEKEKDNVGHNDEMTVKIVVKNEGGTDTEIIFEDALKEEKLEGELEEYSQVSTLTNSCQLCGKSFKTKKQLSNHSRIHNREQSTCEYCEKTFDCKKYLVDHIYKQHKQSIQCSFCDNVLNGKLDYDLHLKDHQQETLNISKENKITNGKTNKSKNECVICGLCFYTKEKLDIHTRKIHEEEEIFETDTAVPENVNDEIVDDPNIANNEHLQPKELDFDNANNIKTVLDEIPNSNRADENKSLPNTCLICNKSFKSEKHLHWHQRYHKVDSILHNCNTCDKSFTTKRKLNDHKLTHKVEHCVCDKCNKTFDRRKHLINHKYKQHKEYSCDKCDAIVHGKYEYERHLKEEHDENITVRTSYQGKEKKHPCEICGKFFHNLSYLKIHLNRHDNKLFCAECDIKFETMKLYSIHMKKIHKTTKITKKFSCEICGKLFSGSHILKKHLKTHEDGWNQLKCATCSRVFSSEDQMGAHICKHFTCDICSQKFVRVRNLEFHKREHAGETMFPCDSCEALFDKKKRLGEHKRFVHHGVRRYKCTVCPKKFAVKSGLNNHLLIHTGERPYKCEACDQTFRLKSSLDIHNRMHTNELPFECESCHQKFRMLGNLKAHRETKMCGFSENDLFRNIVEN